MDWDSIFDEVINSLHPHSIPVEFIISAKYTDWYGSEHELYGRELLKFLRQPQDFAAREAQIVLDIGFMRRVMREAVNEFLRSLDDCNASQR